MRRSVSASVWVRSRTESLKWKLPPSDHWQDWPGSSWGAIPINREQWGGWALDRGSSLLQGWLSPAEGWSRAVGIISSTSADSLVCTFTMNYFIYKTSLLWFLLETYHFCFLPTVFWEKATSFTLRMYRVAPFAREMCWNPRASEECRRRKKAYALSLSQCK